MANVSYHIANLLEKMTSADKDFRFMATNDLMSELQKDAIKLDEDSERKVVKMLLKLLEDKNGEVQNLAVKCMGPLVNKVKEHHVEVIVDTLCSNMTSDQEQLRDVSSVGLKTVIDQLPPSSNALTSNTCRRVTPKIVSAVQSGSNADVAIQLEGLDILADLLLRYGGILSNFHQSIQEALMPLLSARLAVRKRAITALGHLVAVCSQGLFNVIADALIAALEKNTNISTTRTFVSCVGAVSKASGPRFGHYLPRIVPILVSYCDKIDDDELREGCLQSFESIMLKCPKEVTPHLHLIIRLCSKYLCHDPNYHYDDDDDVEPMDGVEKNGDMDVDSGHGEQDSDEDQEYSDDDDMSWKVRRASAKCLEAALSTRREMLVDFYHETSPLLISRFKEREENVKADIFRAYIALLKHTKLVVPTTDAKLDEQGLLKLLQSQVPRLVRSIGRQLKEKSLKTRQCCFAVLTELLRVSPGSLSDHMSVLIPGVQHAMTDRLSNSNMKIDTLSFLGVALATHSPQVFYQHVLILIPLIVGAVDDPFYKVTAEALAVVQQLVRVLRPPETPSSFDWPPFVGQLYKAVYSKLKATDIDQEVKERAISCIGHLLATFGDFLQAETAVCLPVLLDRLKNEVTRLTTVRALIVVSQSPLKISLQPIFAPTVVELSEFLRKNQRALRLATLQLLTLLVENYQTLLNKELINKILSELPALINESDLQIAQMSVALLTDLLKIQPASVSSVLDAMLAPICKLIQSPLLQGPSLAAVVEFLVQLNQSGLQRPSFKDLKDMLIKLVYDPQQHQGGGGAAALHRQSYQSSAKCLAALVAKRPQEAPQVVQELVGNLKEHSKCNDQMQLYSLSALGEIGRRSPKVLEGHEVEQAILRGFQSHSEELKTAASYALGGVAVGNLEKFLPFVLNEIQSQPKRQYLLLHSLKEIISSESAMVDTETVAMIFKPHVDDIWKVLISHAECNEEGVRNVVAECLGKLCLFEPQRLLPKLKNLLSANDNPLIRATIVTSLKFTIVDQPQPVDELLKSCIGDFLDSINDADMNVRRVALVTFNSAAHNKPTLIRDLLLKLLPSVYGETKVRKELIREVEMGPFKHTVDDGLDLRKAAFECMYTLLETCLERLDVFEFLNHVEDGLKDHYDIKMLTYLMLIRLATLCPTQVYQRLDRLVEPIKQTCVAKVKANAVKQEYEKQDELKRCAMRAVLALQVKGRRCKLDLRDLESVPDADKSAHLNELLQMIRTTPELFQLYEGVQKDPGSRLFFGSGDGGQAMEVDT